MTCVLGGLCVNIFACDSHCPPVPTVIILCCVRFSGLTLVSRPTYQVFPSRMEYRLMCTMLRSVCNSVSQFPKAAVLDLKVNHGVDC